MKLFWPNSAPSQAGAAPLEPVEMHMPNQDESIFSQLHSHGCVFKQSESLNKRQMIHSIPPYLHQWEFCS